MEKIMGLSADRRLPVAVAGGSEECRMGIRQWKNSPEPLAAAARGCHETKAFRTVPDENRSISGLHRSTALTALSSRRSLSI
jgi:hypothetical protein